MSTHPDFTPENNSGPYPTDIGPIGNEVVHFPRGKRRAGEATDTDSAHDPDLVAAVAERLARMEARTYTGNDILEKVTARKWLVDGWLPLNGLVGIYAPSGIGKSFLAGTLAFEIARGGWWAGVPLDVPRSVLYVAGEKPQEMRDRFEAWKAEHGIEDLPAFHLTEDAPQLTNPLEVRALCELIRQREARVVVLDTFARLTLGIEENSARDIGPAMAALDMIREATDGGIVVVVHHTGKDASKGARGSTAFLAALDVGIVLTGDPAALRAKVEKANAGPEPLPEWYRIKEVWLPETEPLGPKRRAGVLLETQAREVAREDDPSSLKVLEELGPLTANQFREALGEELGREVTKATGGRILKRLVDQGKAAKSEERYPRYSLAHTYPQP